MKATYEFIRNMLMASLLAMMVASCSKEESDREFFFLDLEPIDFETVEPVLPDYFWTEETSHDYLLNGQDYSVNLEISSWQSETLGTQYGATIVLCNAGNQAIDFFELELVYNGARIYNSWISAFKGPCQVFYFTNIFQGAGTYEVRIKLPAGHHDFSLNNNKETVTT